jgi:predicted enzyme related to lactoylglutathione lyase
MRKLAICLIILAISIVVQHNPASARGFGDNDISQYYGKGSSQEQSMDMNRSTARMPVGSGEHWVSWLEFVTSDTEASAAFFGDVFGWEIMPFMEGYSLWMPSQTEGIVGCGFSSESMGQAAVYYIYEADIDGRLAAIEAAGGSTLMPKMPIAEGMPNIAVFRDNSGVVVGLVDAALPAADVPFVFGKGKRPSVNRFCSIEMYSAGFPGTSEFFREQFGWDTQPAMEGYLSWNSGAGLSGVFQSHTPDMPVIAYIFVDDVQAALDAVTAAGGTTFGDAMSMEGIATFGYFTDPGGVVMGLIGN